MENAGVGSQKHKKLGYQMLKDKYVGKANVVKGKMSYFLVKRCVNAAMKSNVKLPCICSFKPSKHEVYTAIELVRLGKGRCKHIVGLHFK